MVAFRIKTTSRCPSCGSRIDGSREFQVHLLTSQKCWQAQEDLKITIHAPSGGRLYAVAPDTITVMRDINSAHYCVHAVGRRKTFNDDGEWLITGPVVRQLLHNGKSSAACKKWIAKELEVDRATQFV